MNDHAIFILLATVICIGGFLNGMRFSRMTENPLAGRKLLGMPIEGSQLSVETLRRMGRIFMYVTPVMWVFFVVVAIFEG
jgi:hypothetical protein